MPLTTVFFDVGETLVDETRLWRLWAEWFGVEPEDFFAALAEVIEGGEHHQRVFERFQPGFDVAEARRQRELRGWPPDTFEAGDLYADAIPCLHALRGAGYRLGIAGNQPAATEQLFRDMGPLVEIVGSSESWGVEKPSPAFFARLLREAAVPACEVAYVGDRLDGDVLPSLEAGLTAIFLQRGPWGTIQGRWPAAGRASLRIRSLAELPSALQAVERGSG